MMQYAAQRNNDIKLCVDAVFKAAELVGIQTEAELMHIAKRGAQDPERLKLDDVGLLCRAFLAAP